jgi:hypothetical protein
LSSRKYLMAADERMMDERYGHERIIYFKF